MEARSTIHDRFVTRFHAGERPKPVPNVELDSIEAALDTKLPWAFREFMARFGPVDTPGILDELTDRGLDHPDIQAFLSAEDAIENTKGYWSAGMPDDVIGFASDCIGKHDRLPTKPRASR